MQRMLLLWSLILGLAFVGADWYVENGRASAVPSYEGGTPAATFSPHGHARIAPVSQVVGQLNVDAAVGQARPDLRGYDLVAALGRPSRGHPARAGQPRDQEDHADHGVQHAVRRELPRAHGRMADDRGHHRGRHEADHTERQVDRSERDSSLVSVRS